MWRQRTSELEGVRGRVSGPVRLRGHICSDLLSGTGPVVLDTGKYRVRLFFRDRPHGLHHGDRVLVYGIAFVPVSYKNPGSFDLRAWMDREGVAYWVRVRRWRVLGRCSGPLCFLHRLRERLSRFCRRLGPSVGPFAAAVVLGDRRAFGKRLEHFYTLGLGHVLAVSGLHLGVFVAVLYFVFLLLLKPLCLFVRFPLVLIPKRLSHLLVLALVPVIVVLSGSQISVVRASVMYGAYVVFGVLLERDASLFRTILFALAVLLLFEPWQLESCGFQYTFCAVLLLALLGERFSDKGAPFRWILASLLLPFALSPIAAYHFHRVYPLAFLFNLLLLPIFTVAIALVFPLLFLSYAVGGPFLWALRALDAPLGYILGFMETASRSSFCIYTSRLHWALLCAFSFALLWGVFRAKWALVLALAFLVFSGYILWDMHRDRVIFFDMGPEGEAALVVSDGVFLVNAGGLSGRAYSSLRDALLWEGIRRIDRFVCLLKGKRGEGFLDRLVRDFDVVDVRDCSDMVEGNCREARVGGVDFVCLVRHCSGGVCKVLGGPVIYRGERMFPHVSGAVKIYLEGMR